MRGRGKVGAGEPGERAENRQRWLVEIESWDWALGLTMAWPGLPEDAKVNGEQVYTRGVDLRGRVIAPKVHSGKAIWVWLSPSPLRYWSAPDPLDEVGQFEAYEEPLNGRCFGATILIPEDSLSNVLTCLSSVWRYIHIWTLDPFPRASISAVSFARDVHKNLEPWIRGEGDADF
jgi:hypothetical protein